MSDMLDDLDEMFLNFSILTIDNIWKYNIKNTVAQQEAMKHFNETWEDFKDIGKKPK